MKPQLFRQGDVLIRRVAEIPKKLVAIPKDRGRTILAYGEVTGHAHAVEGEVEFLAADVAELERAFLRVLDEEGADVVHEEHDTIHLPAGDYEVRRQREYAPERSRWVAD